MAKGIYLDRYGYAVRWRDRGRPVEKRFPLDTPLDRLKDYRREQLRQAEAVTQATQPGSFVRDAIRFLRLRKGRPAFKSDRAHLRAWIARFRTVSRWHVTPEHVERAMAWWRGQGYSASEIRHRFMILRQFYRSLDGPRAKSPCDGVKPPSKPKPRPMSVSDQVVRDIALNLWKAEQVSYLRNAKTRARYLVLATTGQRPAQLKRARPEDVDLEQRVWFVRPAKGDAGTTLFLNDDMVQAWQVFLAAHAWGPYDSRSFAKVLKRNGWPKQIRPYNLRHSVGLGLSARQVDLGDIQSHLGHASPVTTRIYVPGVPERAKVASAKLDGRLGPTFGASLSRETATIRSERKAKARHKAPHSARVQEQRIGRRKKAHR